MLCFCLVTFSLTSGVAFAGGVTVITHGHWSTTTGWVDWMANSIVKKFNDQNTSIAVYTLKIHRDGTNEITGNILTQESIETSLQSTSGQTIIKLDWSELSEFSPSFSTAELAPYIVDRLINGYDSVNHFLSFPIHLIGHSRGGSLVCEIAKLLGEKGIFVDQVTTLDPKPLDGNGEPQDLGDAPAGLYENVLFADNYWQDNALTIDPDGQEVDGAYNRKLVQLNSGYTLDHADTHLWYHGTIEDDTPFWDGEINLTSTMRSNWWEQGESQGANTGHYFSRNLGGNRLSTYSANSESNRVIDGVHYMFGGNGFRTAQDRTGANWPNIIKLELFLNGLPLTGDSAAITIDESTIEDKLEIKYVGQDYNSSSTVTIYIDADRNPYNNNSYVMMSEGNGDVQMIETHGATSTGYFTGSFEIDTNFLYIHNRFFGSQLYPYIYAKITDGPRTRYMYAKTKIETNSPQVNFNDSNLKASIEEEFGVANPTIGLMQFLENPEFINKGIVDLTGLEYAVNLRWLKLTWNQITNISALSGLTNLKVLDLGGNQIYDISALSGLTNLEYLILHNNQISDISALSGLTNLLTLNLYNNPLNNEAITIFIPMIEAYNSGNIIYGPIYSLNISSTSLSCNEGGLIVQPPGGEGTYQYGVGYSVLVTASPNPGFKVNSWNGTDDDSSTSTTNTVTMNSDKNVTVIFQVDNIATDSDGDGFPDGDGTNNCIGGNTADCDDNCALYVNCDQADRDSDGVGDACDSCTDVDGDEYAMEGGECSLVDCDDGNAAINPETFWYQDNDGDSFGNYSLSLQQCLQPAGPLDYVLNDLDYDDYDSGIGAPVKIDNATPSYFRSLQAAYNAAIDGDYILTIDAIFFENLSIDTNKSITFSGGYDGTFAPTSGDTTLNGDITISNGTLSIENFLLQ